MSPYLGVAPPDLPHRCATPHFILFRRTYSVWQCPRCGQAWRLEPWRAPMWGTGAVSYGRDWNRFDTSVVATSLIFPDEPRREPRPPRGGSGVTPERPPRSRRPGYDDSVLGDTTERYADGELPDLGYLPND